MKTFMLVLFWLSDLIYMTFHLRKFSVVIALIISLETCFVETYSRF